ncbi:hypothetical protein ACPXCG_18845 [Gordonia sp. DT218]|uniref:hypothetical protein n=1 Tax=Gordonia sp. DT218 TaxID=3416659 RepID=UPI003CF7F5CB
MKLPEMVCTVVLPCPRLIVRNRQKTPLQKATEELASAVRDAGMDTKEFAAWSISAKGPGLNIAQCTDVRKLEDLTRRVQAEGAAILGEPSLEDAQSTLSDALGAEGVDQ